MALDALYSAWFTLPLPRDDDDPALRDLVAAARLQLASATTSDWEWLSNSLSDQQRSYLVVFVVEINGSVPELLYEPMMKAAVYEVDPSKNRWFIEPCIRSLGFLRINETLLSYLQNGTDFEKAGAANAMYWADVGRAVELFEREGLSRKEAKRKAKSVHADLAELMQKQKRLLLEEFVNNLDVDVRRSIVRHLRFRGGYPWRLRSLVKQAIRIARAHEDEYIRHRIKVELGRVQLFYPLPERRRPQASPSKST